MKRADSMEGPQLVDIRALQGTEFREKVQNTVALFGSDENERG